MLGIRQASLKRQLLGDDDARQKAMVDDNAESLEIELHEVPVDGSDARAELPADAALPGPVVAETTIPPSSLAGWEAEGGAQLPLN